MAFYIENEVNCSFPFDIEETVTKVIRQALFQEGCQYETEVNLLITDKEGIREYNRDYRGIDKDTDVLSFPGVDYENPADFSIAEANENDYFNPDTGELILGDIILCEERIREQAEEYGHSLLREFSFLIAHSVLHLLGYDHIEPDEEADMFARQEKILEALHIGRET